MVSSMAMVPSSLRVKAGQPGLKHAPHFLHFSVSGLHLLGNFSPFRRAQGAWVMMTDSASAFTSSRITFSSSFWSKALTSHTLSIPNERHSPAMLMAGTISPFRVFPVAAWSWCPVIPVVELSRMMTVALD